MRIIRTLALGAAAVLLWTAARALAGPLARRGPDRRSVRVRDGAKDGTDRVDDRADRTKGGPDPPTEEQAKKTDDKDPAAGTNERGTRGGKAARARSPRSRGA